MTLENEKNVSENCWQPTHLDFALSPYSGLTRESWIDAGKYLLSGIFQNLQSIEEPIVMPRKETKVTYPHLSDPEELQDAQRRAEIFEGLTRSFFIASVLLKEEPDLVLNNIPIREYYKKHILLCCSEGSSFYVGDYEYLQKTTGASDPFRPYQQTVETCALVIGLWACREQIWAEYTKEEKDLLASFLTGFAHAPTVPQNWRLFNMLDMAFLHMEGYPIKKEIMADHAAAILDYYVGDGWYRDGHSFDYYSCWAFQFYTPLWNLWYGYEEEPEIAACFEENSNKLMESYPKAFDRDGFTNMWGRSGIYRNAATSAFDGNLFLKHPTADPGLARRISSGSLLQFLTRDDFRFEGIPTLGFYGQFMPLVQGYSCAESPFWLGKAFLCLHLPADHPFWTEKENNGVWDRMAAGDVTTTTLNGPGLCYSNHNANGETVLRTGKILKQKDDLHGMWNYSKLCFNTKYPWESSPAIDHSVESQQYVLCHKWNDEIKQANVTFWGGEKDGVLYRRQYFDFNLENERHWIQGMNLADFTVPYGIIRADKLRLHKRPVSVTFGSYGFPDNGNVDILRKEKDGARAIILKGRDHMGKEKQMAVTIYDGWEEMGTMRSAGTNPDSDKSIVVYLYMESRRLYDGSEPYYLISQIITKESFEDFTEEEIFPIEKIEYTDRFHSGATGPCIITLRSGEKKVIDYSELEGRLSL
ncbi:MAG: DUF2264 domain-containing protein [Lachnospiraceae bacterium]|nr:DUF2264 domain-containing protein [Lachnospiraceae bacterium]